MSKVKIRMLEDAEGYPNGVTLEKFAEGEEYTTTQDLADCFVVDGHAEYVDGESVASKDPAKSKAKSKAK